MNIALAIFAKNSNISPVKTRLAKDIGEAQAKRFYQLSLLAVSENIKAISTSYNDSLDIYWALAEQESITMPEWNAFDPMWTGEGDLGQRLHNVYSTLINQYDAVIIIGSDSPCMPKDIILDAIACMQSTKGVVFSPVTDGGFCLVAGNVPIDKLVWCSVKYSEPSTLKAITQAMQAQ